MLKQIIEEGATVEINGVECRILSVGEHNVNGEPAGFSYSFRPVEDIEKDEDLARQAEERRRREEVEAAEARAQESENAPVSEEEAAVEENSEVESENSPEGSDEKTTQENGLPVN